MAATDTGLWGGLFARRHCLAGLLGLLASQSLTGTAAVLPEDRVDVLYHGFDGGGATIEGPSILVRKGFADKISVSANYYVDMVSSASIDVQATASPYEETRSEASLGIDYLHDSTTMSVGLTLSEENDYSASTIGAGITQSLFGDLTTLTMTASLGKDTVRRNGDDTFEETAERRRFGLNISQVVSPEIIVALNVESVVDAGYLNNPYRSVRFVDPGSELGYSYESEVYPRTRNSDAVALRAIAYMPWRASLRGEYRYYSDSWGIVAHTMEVKYVHPVSERLTVEAKVRGYDQSAAAFFSDLFEFKNAQSFLARDKELSDFTSHSIGLGVSYAFTTPLASIDRSTVNLYWDHMRFRYGAFRDVTQGGAPGTEPSYGFNANVLRIFVSFWY